MYQSVSTILHLWQSITSGNPGVECSQQFHDMSGELYISSCCRGYPSSVLVSNRMCHQSIQTFDSNCTLLDGGSLASHNFQHVGRHSSLMSCHNKSCQGCFSRLGAQGSAITPFNLWLLRDVCCADKGSFSFWQAMVGKLSVYNKSFPAVVGRNGQAGVFRSVYHTVSYLPLN